MMRRRVTSFSLLLVIFVAGCWRERIQTSAATIPQLELVKAYPVDVPGPLEPSGLVLHDGSLYTIADKDNDTIYRIVVEGDTCRLVPHLHFRMPSGYVMDWEGITTDTDGNFFLISEYHSRIARVDSDGNGSWVSPDLSVKSSEIGLFSTANAGFEGITWLGPNHWLGAVEREPRGLVEFRKEGTNQVIHPSLQEQSPYSNVLNMVRIPDYSGLCNDAGRIYALFRNAHLVVELEQTIDSFRETNAWSYAHIETDPELAFIEQTYGQAEGLDVDGKDVYIIFDNNLGGRQADPNDRRPLFVHARMPD